MEWKWIVQWLQFDEKHYSFLLQKENSKELDVKLLTIWFFALVIIVVNITTSTTVVVVTITKTNSSSTTIIQVIGLLKWKRWWKVCLIAMNTKHFLKCHWEKRRLEIYSVRRFLRVDCGQGKARWQMLLILNGNTHKHSIVQHEHFRMHEIKTNDCSYHMLFWKKMEENEQSEARLC